MGYGKRSDFQAKDYLADILQCEVIPLKLVDPYFYHLDMCFLPISEQIVAINPRSFDEGGLELIRKNFRTVIETSPEDNQFMGCNAEVIVRTIVVAAGISKNLKSKYAELGYTTKEIPMDEYRKGGGSIKCLSLEFHQTT
jgi:N-dimethylarginine dimethylaminohydrolase